MERLGKGTLETKRIRIRSPLGGAGGGRSGMMERDPAEMKRLTLYLKQGGFMDM